MKFRAFTLTEIIITVGLIGVLAVITAPAISDLMPDKNKVIVLKLYEQLKGINEEMISDPGLYFQENNCEGFSCAATPLRMEGLLKLTDNNSAPVDYKDNSKYPALIANKFNRESAVVINQKDANGEYTSVAFIPIPGVECKIYSRIKTENSVPNFEGLVLITIFGNSSDRYNDPTASCRYSDDCLNPNRYILTIAPDGSILPADPVTKAYLRNPVNVLSKKKAKQLIKLDTSYTWPDWAKKLVTETLGL